MMFIKLTDDYDKTAERIIKNAACNNIDTEPYTYKSASEFKADLNRSHQPFDYLYIGAHGNPQGIAAGRDFIRWADFALDLCGNQGLNEKCVVYLGCCKGGLKVVAQILMTLCDGIHHVVGAGCDIDEQEANIAFHTFSFAHCRGALSTRIEESISLAINQNFSIFNRSDMLAEITAFRSAKFTHGIDEYIIPNDFYSTADLEERYGIIDGATR